MIKIWDERRLIVPLQYFIENSFQNWTRSSTELLGSLFLWVDYKMPLDPLRQELERLCKEAPTLWDGRLAIIQVTDTSDKAIQLRVLVSSSNASNGWDLRCLLREKLVQFIATNNPEYLPQLRTHFFEEQAGQIWKHCRGERGIYPSGCRTWARSGSRADQHLIQS